MRELLKVLTNLNALDDVKTAFAVNNIEFNETNLKAASIGFEKITEVLSSTTLILSESVADFISKMRKKQENELLEQNFALLGTVYKEGDNKRVCYANGYIEDKESERQTATSAIGGKDFYQKINAYLNDKSIPNKILLMGHTHPNFDKLSTQTDFIDERANIRDAIESLTDNSLKLRKRGLNPSIGDINSLILGQSDISPFQLLMGIALPNDEFNVLYYNGITIKTLDNIFVMRSNKLEPVSTFRTNCSTLKK